MKNLPLLVGVSADYKILDGSPYHTVGDKYVNAAAVGAKVAPLIIPAIADRLDIPGLLQRLDGLLITGSPSNVHPQFYDTQPSTAHEPYDLDRDNLTLLMIREALSQGLPLLAICRGFQELNVALGGSLHTEVQLQEGRLDHRRPQHPDLDIQYGPSHEVEFIANGQFAAIFGQQRILINSLHRQAINRLAPDLTAEGFAPDGTIEAVSVKNAKAFALGVQWHPEYKVLENNYSLRLFQTFGEAVKQRARN